MSDQSAYDPTEDPDADPAQLNPRTGEAAGRDRAGSVTSSDDEERDDQDSDPASMNPRSGDQARPHDQG